MAPGRRHTPRVTQSTQSEPIRQVVSDETTISSSVASTSTKKGRGRSKNLALHKELAKNGGRRIPIVIPRGLREPVGKYDLMFKTEVGIIVKMNPPVAASTWDDVPEQVLSAWHRRLQESFDIDLLDPHTVDSVNSYCMKRLKEFRYELHKHYRNTEDPRSHPPANVSQSDWDVCCTRYESEAFKARSAQNSRSRAQQTISHCGGSRSFAQHRYELEEEQGSVGSVGVIELYRRTHYNRKTGLWSCDDAKKNYEAMVAMKGEHTTEGSTPPTEEEILERVLGRRSGYFRGLGHGVQPQLSRSNYHTAYEERVQEANARTGQALQEVAEMRTTLEEVRTTQEQKAQEHERQIAELRAMIESMRGQMGSTN